MLPDSHWEVKLASVVWQPLDQGDSHGGVRSHQIQDLLGLVRERGVKADSKAVAWAAGGMELPLTEMGEDHQWNNFEGRAVWSSHERSGLDWSTCNTHCLYNFRRGRKELMVKIMEVLIVWQWPQGRKHFQGVWAHCGHRLILGGQAFSGWRLKSHVYHISVRISGYSAL